jgi:N-acetylmuramoyl-L-alanine amidase
MYASDGLGVHTVVIDAGHGGQDPGAKGRFSHEKDVVLAIALKVGNLIEENMKDVKVIYTRNTDVFIPLHERADIANKHKADLFISIHANANPNKQVYGSETYVMGLHTNKRNLEVAKKENDVIVLEDNYSSHYEGYDPNSSESFIIFSLMQNAFLDKSLSFATTIQSQMRNKAKRTDRGVKQAGFLVLWRTTMPSVLVETGFITNPAEEVYLNSDAGQNALASSIYKAFKNYKLKAEHKNISEIENEAPSEVIPVKHTKRNHRIKPDTVAQVAARTVSTSVEVNNEACFKVQIGLSDKPLQHSNSLYKKARLIDSSLSIEEIKVGKLYKYYIGNTTSYKTALTLQEKARKQFSDAFVVAWQSGNIIPLKQALNK